MCRVKKNKGNIWWGIEYWISCFGLNIFDEKIF